MSTSSSSLIGPSLKKSSSDKRFKLPASVEHNRPGKVTPFEAEGTQEGEEADKEEESEEQREIDVDVDVTEGEDAAAVNLQEQNGGEDADDDLELPPPMKPITEPILVTTANGPSGSAIPNELPGKRVSTWFAFRLSLAHPMISVSSLAFSRFSSTSLRESSSTRSNVSHCRKNALFQQSAERTTKILDGATTADLSEIEQIVKERMVSLGLIEYFCTYARARSVRYAKTEKKMKV